MGDKRIEFSKVRNDSGNDSSFLGDLLCCYLVYSQKKEESHSRKAKKEDDMCFDYCFCRIFYVKFSQVYHIFCLSEKAVSFYGNTKPQGQPLIGTETALVPQLNDGLELSIYHKKQNKWKLPCWLLNEDSIHNDIDENTNKYMVSVIWEGNTDGRYIILWETRSQDCKRRNVRDSENSRFTYFSSKPVEGVVNKFYYSYLKDTPSNYKLYIDDYEIEVGWEKLLKDNQ